MSTRAMPGREGHDPLDRLEQQRRSGGWRAEFRRQLAECDARLIAAGRLVAEMIVPVTTAFLQADRYGAAKVVTVDVEVDRRCVQLEETCYALLARQSPVAGDLRRVVAVLRSSLDVQRSGNLLRHVADALTWVHPPAMPEDLRETVARLGAVSGEIFAGALQAWESHDGLAANELQKRDDQVDLLQKFLLTDLYTGRQSVEEAVSLALIARYYERIADHGVEMARQVAYFLTGARLTDPD